MKPPRTLCWDACGWFALALAICPRAPGAGWVTKMVRVQRDDSANYGGVRGFVP